MTIKVTATNIAGDGVPGNGQPLDQDYALIVYNVGAIAMNSGGIPVAAESCPPGNGAVDPGETVTVNFGLANGGSASTTNLVATLQESGGVSGSGWSANLWCRRQPVGVGELHAHSPLPRARAAVRRSPRHSNSRDGASDLGLVRFTFPTGLSHTESVRDCGEL